MSFWPDICMHTSFFMAFLTGFYFLFVTYSQTNSLTNVLYNSIREKIISVSALSTPSVLQKFQEQINVFIENAQQYPDNSQKNNPGVLKAVSIIVGILAPFLFCLSVYLEWVWGGSVSELLISNCIVLLFIAATEFIIVGVFLYNFVVIDSDFVTAIIPVTNGTNYDCNFVKPLIKSLFPFIPM